jgi:hypothetical protein
VAHTILYDSQRHHCKFNKNVFGKTSIDKIFHYRLKGAESYRQTQGVTDE